MDDVDLQASPRKKLKAEHISMDGTMDDAMVIDETANIEPAPYDQQAVSREHLRKEAECGITEFVSPQLLGFTGILKKRYTDFLVNEILPSGLVVHLDNLKDSQRGKQVDPSNDAKVISAIFVGKKSTHNPAPLEPILPENGNGDETKARGSPQLNTEQNLSSDDLVDGGVLLPKTQESEHIGHEKGLSNPRQLALEPASGPRRKHKVILRQTGSGILVVEDNDKTKRALPSSREGLDHETSCYQQNEGTMQAPACEQGNVVDFTKDIKNGATQEPPKSCPQPSSTADWQAYANASKGFKLSSEDRDLLISYLDAEVVDSTLSLYNHIINSPHRKPRDYGAVKSAVIADRETRTKIHQAMRRIFQSRLDTATDDNGAVIISAAAPKSNWSARPYTTRNDGGRKSQAKAKTGWKELGGEYLHFTLFKENKDTMEIISYLARQLKMKPQSFQFAGTKDRRGITVQRVSVFRVFSDRMIAAGRTLRNAKVGNFEYQPHGLQLGELKGNEFVITLRDCDIGDKIDAQRKSVRASKIVSTAIENLRERGFINYYGLQRFGTFSTRTDSVGVKMIQGDFKAAVEAILYYTPTSLAAAQNPMSVDDRISTDDKARAYALHKFKETGKLHLALDELPRKFSAEANIIRHLGNPGRSNDYLGALQSISRNLRLMYVHAYQSLIWNAAASERWKRYGATVIEGDLVLIDEHREKVEKTVVAEDIDVDGEAIVHPGDDDDTATADEIFTRARALSATEANSGDYSIFDIVLPTPGFDIIYPANEISAFYKEFMASDRGGGLDPFDMRRKWKDVSLSGSYRKVLARPGNNVSYEIKNYEDENQQFVQTDLDRLLGARQHGDRQYQQPQQSQNPSAIGGMKDPMGIEQGTKDEGSKIAVILKLQLGTSQYATMALRELMKVGGVQTYKPDFGGGR